MNPQKKTRQYLKDVNRITTKVNLKKRKLKLINLKKKEEFMQILKSLKPNAKSQVQIKNI